jgi:hypothetical protein
MSDPHTDRPEPSGDQVGEGQVSEEQIREDVAALSELIATGVEVDGEVQLEESTWAIYGRTSYDGETIVGEYYDAVEATEVYRAVLRPAPDPDSEHDQDPPAR